jgi:carbon monoxide dehydrogenase subunit G
MRIEGVYTIAARIERVYAALADPEMLAHAIPGTERVIQLGPPTPEGAIAFEVRIRTPDDYTYTVTAVPIAAREPAHLRLELRGFGAAGPLQGRLVIDLVEDEEHTIGAYVCDLEAAGLSGDDALAQAQDVARTVCDRLSDGLRAQAETDQARHAIREAAQAAQRKLSFSIRTPRGRIVALPPLTRADEARVSSWGQRLLWLSTGIALGVGSLSLALTVLRWFTGRRRGKDHFIPKRRFIRYR